MGDNVYINTGSGGIGVGGRTGVGGRAGDASILVYNPVTKIYEAESPDLPLLMSLPRALYAAHDSGHEAAPSSCLEGTRVAVLEKIMSWLESADAPPVYWLNGLAGIGKSTIAKTIAEQAEERAMLGASFFFSRSDKPLRDPQLVFPTLAFQLAYSDSALRKVIVDALQQDPRVGHKKLLLQLQGLILTPLLKIDHSRRPTLIVLDALDECEEQGAADILRLLFLHVIRIPFIRILITSRPQPHISSVFSKVLNLAKTVLHDIEASVVQRDIRFYISHELAKIPEKLGLPLAADWTTEDQRNSLVERSGKLFVYAATSIRFIGDDRVRDPHGHLSLILNTQSAQEAGATPYAQLDELYMGVLRNSLSTSNHREILKRFRIVVGSIVVLREPLPLYSLARFVRYDRHVVETTLYHLHSVIIPPSDIHEAPRIYHPSFLEFITDASRCSMVDFVIVPVPEQELRHAIRCFKLMAKHLKRNIAGISDPSLLNSEVYGFEQKVRDALAPEVQYACRYWSSHLSRVELGEKKMVEALAGFSMRSLLWWFEAMSLIGSVTTAVNSIQEAHRWAMGSKCKLILVTLLSDAYRFILAHGEVVRGSALHVYHSALPFTPPDTVLHKTYCQDANESISVLQGVESQWPQNLSTLLGHSGPVFSVAFSPDGLRLASGSEDCTLRLWNAISGAEIAKLEGHSGWVNIVAFSPDGLRLASGSYDRTLRLWDVNSGAQIAKLEGHSISANTVAFSLDGLRLVSGSYDCTLRLWDAISGAQIARLEGHSGAVYSVAFSPDGLRLASGSYDCTLRLWDAISGTQIAKLEGHSDRVNTVAFSPDGLRLASASNDLRLWDGTSGAHIAKLEGHSGEVRTVAFSSDGLRIASGSYDCTIRLWDAILGVQIAKLEGHSTCVYTIAFSPDGLRLASGSNDLRLWDAISGAQIARLEGHRKQVRTVAFSPDGSRLVSGSDDSTLWLWDAISSAQVETLERYSEKVNFIAFSPDGLRMVSCSDHTANLWDATSGAHIAKLEGHSQNITSVTFSLDGLCLVSCSDDYTPLRLWDAISGSHMATLGRHSGMVTSVVLSPDGLRLVTTSYPDTAQLWDAISGAQIATLKIAYDSVVFSADSSLFALCFYYTLELYDAISGAYIARLDGRFGKVLEIKFFVDDCILAIRTDMGTSTWNLNTRPPSLRSSSFFEVPPRFLPPLDWSLQGQWIQVRQRQDHRVRRICYIPALYSPNTEVYVSSQRIQSRIAFGCEDGRLIILTIRHDPFDVVSDK